MELFDEIHGKAEDAHVEYYIRHARANIHDWVIRCGSADDPIAPERPDLKEDSEQERDQPGAGDKYHDVDHHRKPLSGKESSVKAEY